jgi:carbamoyl-phosphate synthase large subunit
MAARCMAGQSLASQGITKEVIPPYFSVKEAVFPFNKFPGVDPSSAPRCVHRRGHGRGQDLWRGHAQEPAGRRHRLPRPLKADQGHGVPVITVKNSDKARAVEVARELVAQGFDVVATKGTAAAIAAAGMPVQRSTRSPKAARTSWT